MASAYIKGMRGDNPNYIKTAATLKYFTGYNSEDRPLRVSIDPLHAFMSIIWSHTADASIEGGAEGVMTASKQSMAHQHFLRSFYRRYFVKSGVLAVISLEMNVRSKSCVGMSVFLTEKRQQRLQ